jgi:hypothetical protein
VSPLAESPVHFWRNSNLSELAVSISSNLSKVDAQDLIASGRVAPKGDTENIWVGGNLTSLSESDPRLKATIGYTSRNQKETPNVRKPISVEMDIIFMMNLVNIALM